MAPSTAVARLFCLEGEWDDAIDDRQSVLPILEVLERQDVLRFVHRNAHSTVEFEHHLGRWAEHGPSFDLIYLAFHGSADGLVLSEGQEVSLARLGTLMRGLAKGAVIHFSSCSVLDRADEDLASFMRATGARAICGYTKDVDWIDSAAFDLALIYNLATHARAGNALNRMASPAYSGLAKQLGFSRFPRPRAD